MSSFFALVTPINGFDGRPALPGTLPVYPPHPWFPGHLPSGPSMDNTLPGGPPPSPWGPGFPGGFPGFPGQGGGTLPAPPPSIWGPFPPFSPDTGGNLPAPGEPGSPGHLPDGPPSIPLPTGFVWAYSPRYGWAAVVLQGTPHPTP